MSEVPQAAPLRTVDVARESGYSVQQVRDLERLGVIPPAVRSAGSYRSYTPLHVQALRAYRGLAVATGPVEARRLLTELRTATLTDAATAVNAVHARLAGERAEVLRAQQALHAIGAEADASRAGPTGP
ncbi:MerR family transcriptional regulator, partial [Streptomyces sp. NPDC054863]